jgi:hypothetical protein
MYTVSKQRVQHGSKVIPQMKGDTGEEPAQQPHRRKPRNGKILFPDELQDGHKYMVNFKDGSSCLAQAFKLSMGFHLCCNYLKCGMIPADHRDIECIRE